jgi:hypothetical protein
VVMQQNSFNTWLNNQAKKDSLKENKEEMKESKPAETDTLKTK